VSQRLTATGDLETGRLYDYDLVESLDSGY
jgi:hypothetical protein